MGKYNALVIDDHPLVGSGIANFLASHLGFRSVMVVADEESCYRHIRDNGPPDLLIIDFWLSSSTALKLLKEIKNNFPKVRLLVVSGDENNDIRMKVQNAGGHGFVLKNEAPELFGEAVQALMNNQTWFPEPHAEINEKDSAILQKFNLTPRQGEVLQMMMRGLPNKRIASQLSISEPTVKEHISNILKKLGVNTRVEVITLLHGQRDESS
ncbi:response regulator transcription factor [Phytobacter diazotrophicus]|uniref:response regulator transcription factor n=1 Tax=Phytobacter diazotrophicus TaxID=395631 RepID=UPI002911B84D|nr:response regulator transcription factor [Phytobacter diazotrophicus]MDU7199457.1 response regulator transcription factor [Enterobacteriaceae bacterium]MDV2873597.1 response regulator transcription factor [Phytobacter diazotrophicus]